MVRPQAPEPRRRRERGDDGISWDRANKCYVGTISLGYDDADKRLRRTARGKTKQAVKDQLDKLHEEIKAGIETPTTYTVRQCVMDWLDSFELEPHTMATYRGQAEKWIYPKIGRAKLKDFKATDADRFFRDVAKGAQQGIAGEDQKHADQVDPPGAEVRPYRQERRRAGRLAQGAAGTPVAGHD
jgi:hypothetical protein